MSGSDYIIREANKDENSTVSSFLMEHFFPQEYLLSSYFSQNEKNITEEEKQIIEEDFEREHEVILEKDPCLVAVDRNTQKIVGICLMTVEDNPKLTSSANKDTVSDIQSTPMRSTVLSEWFHSVLDVADKKVDFFEKFPSLTSALKLTIVCVDKNYGGKGLGTLLIREAVKWAKNKKISLVHGVFTSPFSRKAAEKIGFKNYADIDILSFRDSKGNCVYNNIDSYFISIMALTL